MLSPNRACKACTQAYLILKPTLINKLLSVCEMSNCLPQKNNCVFNADIHDFCKVSGLPNLSDIAESSVKIILTSLQGLSFGQREDDKPDGFLKTSAFQLADIFSFIFPISKALLA